MEALMEGEIIVDSKVHLGYVHRNVKKIAEKRTYMQYMPYPARFDYVATNLPVTGYCQAVEKLLGLEIPERAEYLRVIMCELSRIASHLLFIASLAIDIGATTGLLYCFRDRERVLDMFEMTSGQRLLSSYVRIGGVSSDLPQSFYSAVESFLEDVPKMIKEYHGLLTGNEIFQARLCSAQLTQTLGREPDDGEVADEMGLSVEELLEIRATASAPLSLEMPLDGNDGDEDEMGELLRSRSVEGPDEKLTDQPPRRTENRKNRLKPRRKPDIDENSPIEHDPIRSRE